jgi:hypothetical protein
VNGVFVDIRVIRVKLGARVPWENREMKVLVARRERMVTMAKMASRDRRGRMDSRVIRAAWVNVGARVRRVKRGRLDAKVSRDTVVQQVRRVRQDLKGKRDPLVNADAVARLDIAAVLAPLAPLVQRVQLAMVPQDLQVQQGRLV